MNELNTQYQQQIQNNLSLIEQAYQQFVTKCEQKKNDTEKQIAGLDSQNPGFNEQQTQLKIALKQDLDSLLKEFELEMRHRFGDNLSALEDIYNKKKLEKLFKLEETIKTL